VFDRAAGAAPAMNVYRRLLDYCRPYWKRMLVLSVVIALFASLSGVSLTLIPPFLRVILDREPASPVVVDSEREGLPLPAFIENARVAAKVSFE